MQIRNALVVAFGLFTAGILSAPTAQWGKVISRQFKAIYDVQTDNYLKKTTLIFPTMVPLYPGGETSSGLFKTTLTTEPRSEMSSGLFKTTRTTGPRSETPGRPLLATNSISPARTKTSIGLLFKATRTTEPRSGTSKRPFPTTVRCSRVMERNTKDQGRFIKQGNRVLSTTTM